MAGLSDPETAPAVLVGLPRRGGRPGGRPGRCGEAQAAKPLVANGGALALFRHAATAYDRPLQFEATGPATSRGFVVWCGPDFVGHVSSAHNDDNSLGRRDAERRKHLERLGLTATQEALDMLAGV